MTESKPHAQHDAIVAHIATFGEVGEAEDAVAERFGVGIMLLSEIQGGDLVAELSTGAKFAIVYA